MRSLPFLNLCFLTLLAILFAAFFTLGSADKTQVVTKGATKGLTSCADAPPKKIELPPNPFKLDETYYLSIGEGPINLKKTAPQCLLPDLRNELGYFGKNVRPDLLIETQGKNERQGYFQIALKASGEKINGESKTVSADQKIYLTYENGYHFSDQATALWIEVKGTLDEIKVNVFMQGEDNALITTPKEAHYFILKAQESKASAQFQSSIGEFKVDTALLMRQHARWQGRDLFLLMHGGDDFAFAASCERVDFQIAEHPFSCFLKEGDFVIWKDAVWRAPQKGEATLNYPLLAVKKIDENAMHFELWDVEGKSRLPLTLFKAKTHEPLPEPQAEFKFVAAKTWAQFIIDCRGKRMILRPNDWLVLTQAGWIRITSPTQVDDFVSQKLQGPLFVVDKMNKINGKQILQGHLFNSSRTCMQEVELDLNFKEHKEKEEEEISHAAN